MPPLEVNESRPISATDGTWSAEDWPADVQRVDVNGIDLSLVEDWLRLTPAERMSRLEQFAEFVIGTWRANGLDVEQCINSRNS